MPAEILRLQEHAAVADSVSPQDAIRGRVTSLLGLYRLSRYRPPPRLRYPPRRHADIGNQQQ